ncbi:MAG: polyprenol monophosphomannose synthase [Chloroflexi bacterium]|nr:polyprenol monophosphomannose synthase [Chloroflexota bacterium]
MLETAVIVPTYNEKDNIATLVPMLLDLPVDLAVIIVDDNSPDGTGDLAAELSAAHPDRVFLIQREGKLGLGTAYLAGFEFALQHDFNRIMTMDADFSHHPRYIPGMVEASRVGVFRVIGSRDVPGGETPDFPLRRRLLSWGANAFTHTLLGLNARDTTAGFRCYRREVLSSLPLDSIFSNGYSFLIEMLWLVQNAGFTVGEVPIVFEDRIHGKSKISQREIARALYTVMRLFARRVLGRSAVVLIGEERPS